MENLHSHQVCTGGDAGKSNTGAGCDTGHVGAVSAGKRCEGTGHPGAGADLRCLPVGAVSPGTALARRVAGLVDHFAGKKRVSSVDARVDDRDHGAGAIHACLQR